MKLNYVIEFVADRSRSWVCSIPDLSLLLLELNPRKLRAKVQVGKPLAQRIHSSRGVSLPLPVSGP